MAILLSGDLNFYDLFFVIVRSSLFSPKSTIPPEMESICLSMLTSAVVLFGKEVRGKSSPFPFLIHIFTQFLRSAQKSMSASFQFQPNFKQTRKFIVLEVKWQYFFQYDKKFIQSSIKRIEWALGKPSSLSSKDVPLGILSKVVTFKTISADVYKIRLLAPDEPVHFQPPQFQPPSSLDYRARHGPQLLQNQSKLSLELNCRICWKFRTRKEALKAMIF